MKFVALVSGGKDSYYSAYEGIRNGHELICCAHLAPPPRPSSSSSFDQEEEESYMYQSAASEVVQIQVTQCLQIPFYSRIRKGKSLQINLVYDSDIKENENEKENDEVEDLYQLLSDVKSNHPDVEAVSSGAILSTYQRTRVESVCSRLNLTSLSYLWRAILHSQRLLLQSMLQVDEFEVVLVKCASPPGLIPQKHLGQNLEVLLNNGTLDRLHEKYDFHVCGEGGEYETLVLDCPLFQRKLVLEETKVELEEEDEGVGVLKIIQCTTKEKKKDVRVWDLRDVGVRKPFLPERMQMLLDEEEEEEEENGYNRRNNEGTSSDSVPKRINENVEKVKEMESSEAIATTKISSLPSKFPTPILLPRVRQVSGGLYHISELMSSSSLPSLSDEINKITEKEKEAQDAEIAVYEFKSILSQLKHILSNLPPPPPPKHSNFTTTSTNSTEKEVVACTPQDVIYVHLYLSNMSHFTHINQHYQKFFGSVLPPSRSCVSVGKHALPSQKSVCMDCMVLRSSGIYMRFFSGQKEEEEEEYVALARKNPHHQLRYTLHVQSISYWAPVCVGPYSQANVVRGGIIWLAGQIGLIPNCMKLISSDSEKEKWKRELKQSWKNAASVLDALCEDGGGGGGVTLNDCLGGLIYINSNVLSDTSTKGNSVWWWKDAKQICRDALRQNGGVKVGSVDGTRGLGSGVGGGGEENDDDELFGGYEDEGTWREIEGDDVVDAILSKRNRNSTDDDDNDVTKHKPLLMVCIPQMPVGASAEVELVCASKKASSCLGGVRNSLAAAGTEENDVGSSKEANTTRSSVVKDTTPIQWDIGYNDSSSSCTSSHHPSSPLLLSPRLKLQSDLAYVGHGCAAMAYVSASFINNNNDNSTASSLASSQQRFFLSIEQVLDDMIAYAVTSLESHAGLDNFSVLNVRLYHVVVDPNDTSCEMNDSVSLRYSLRSVLGSWFGQRRSSSAVVVVPPACTVVPVRALRLCTSDYDDNDDDELNSEGWMAMQVFAADPLHMETEMWIHHGRSYG